MITNKEWVRLTLEHRETSGVPYNLGFSPPARQKIEDHYGDGPIEEFFNFPIRMTGMKSIKPLYADPNVFGKTAKDEYGVKWSTSPIDRGSPTGPCLPEPDLSAYVFPDPKKEYRFELLGDWCEANRDNFTFIWVGDLWERATFMRGMENLLLDLVENPEFVHNLLEGIADYILAGMKIIFSRFEFDGIALSDDYGTQKGMLIAPDCWSEFVRPRVQDVFSFAREHDKTVFHHSCGNVYPIIGELIDIGLDILHPIQPEAMDILQLKREFGDRLSFCGGIPTQHLLPHGTPEEVRAEVRRLKRTMGKGGGYILEPGITLQADVPLENLIALTEEARKIEY